MEFPESLWPSGNYNFWEGGEREGVANIGKLVANLFKEQLDLEPVTEPKATFIPSTQIVVLKYPTLKRKM